MSGKKKKQKVITSQKQAVTKPAGPVGTKGIPDWMYLLILLLVTFVVFYPSLSFQFVNWDDSIYLYENHTLDAFSHEWNWENVKTIFQADVGGNYNPFPIFTYAIEKYFFAPDPKENPFIFHFTNVMLHLICVLLSFRLFKVLGLSGLTAFFAALLFGIHPMRVESVAWVTERKDVLYGAFFLAALLTYLRYTAPGTSKTKWYIFTVLLSILSYFAKIQAVTLPLTMVAIDFLKGRKWFSFKTLVVEKLPWWSLSLVFGLVNVYMLKRADTITEIQGVDYGAIGRLAIGAYSYAIYLIKFVYPYVMAPSYPNPSAITGIFYTALIAVPIAIVAFLFIAWKRQYKVALFAWAFFTFNVMFLLQIVAAGQGFLADRFTYIAYAGLFFGVGYFIDYIIRQKPQYKTMVMGAGAFYLTICFFLASSQVKIWENGATLWEKEMKEYPMHYQGFINAAKYYRDEFKDFEKSLPLVKRGIELLPDNVDNYVTLSKLYVDYTMYIQDQSPVAKIRKARMLDSAQLNYSIALQKDAALGSKKPEVRAEILINSGACYLLTGNKKKALENLTKGLALNPKNENGYANRALIYINANQYELAIKDFDSYLDILPEKTNMYYERGICKYKLGKFKEGLADIDIAISKGDTRPLFYLGKAQIYKAMGNLQAMRENAEIAKKNGIKVPDDLLN